MVKHYHKTYIILIHRARVTYHSTLDRRWAVRLIAPEKAMVEVVWRWMVVGGDRRWDEMGVICR